MEVTDRAPWTTKLFYESITQQDEAFHFLSVLCCFCLLTFQHVEGTMHFELAVELTSQCSMNYSAWRNRLHVFTIFLRLFRKQALGLRGGGDRQLNRKSLAMSGYYVYWENDAAWSLQEVNDPPGAECVSLKPPVKKTAASLCLVCVWSTWSLRLDIFGEMWLAQPGQRALLCRGL